jgi:hypothetical protein
MEHLEGHLNFLSALRFSKFVFVCLSYVNMDKAIINNFWRDNQYDNQQVELLISKLLQLGLKGPVGKPLLPGTW